jgi:hypothetical protein
MRSVAESFAMTIRLTVGDDHRMLTWIVRQMESIDGKEGTAAGRLG